MPKIDWTHWPSELARHYDIRVIAAPREAPEDALWVTRCSKTKSRQASGTPDRLYASVLNRHFFEWAKEQGIRYGVLSDKYGLHLDTAILPTYDVHPRTLTREDKMWLAKTIRSQVRQIGYKSIAFYASSPVRSLPYFEILSFTRLAVFYITRLRR